MENSIKEKISCYISFYYDYDFLEDIINELDNYVSEIILVDGPYSYCVDTLKKFDLFYEHTNKPIEIDNIIKKNYKIKYFYDIWDNEKDKRMFGYEHCTKDIVILADADEFYYFDNNNLINFINSNYSVAGFDIYNMNRHNIYFEKNKISRIYKKNTINSHQHLSYTWLVGVSNLEKQNIDYIYTNKVGTIYHQTLNRNKIGNIIKYIFYVSLYYKNKNLEFKIINNYTYDDLIKNNLNNKNIMNIFSKSRYDSINIPNFNKSLHYLKENIEILNKYSNNYSHGYFTEKMYILNNHEQFFLINKNLIIDEKIDIIFECTNINSILITITELYIEKSHYSHNTLVLNKSNNFNLNLNLNNDNNNEILDILVKINCKVSNGLVGSIDVILSSSWHYKIDTLKYYLSGIRDGVDYKNINNDPKINFQDFISDDLINNLTDENIKFYINSKIKRYDIINFLIDRYNLKEYLEIGVFKGENIRMINVINKDGVDPGAENQIAPEVTHVMTSDVFFNQIDFNKKYDIVFIDGLHEYSQVKKDIQNSFKHLSKDGFIVLHDCNPVSYESQYPIRKTMAWNGDVWKAFVEFKNNNPHHYSCVIDTDFGVGVIKNNHNIEPIFDNTINIDYFKFISDKNKYLNLINWKTFKIVVDKDFNHKKYNKIFQIGFNKCGTTSLHKMFIDSGLKSVHWDGGNIAKKIDSNIKQNKPPLNGVDNYDCYTDIEDVTTNSFPLINYYELLDKAYPNSLFILNTRPLDNWIKSRLNHQSGSYANTFKNVLGVTTDEELITIWSEQWTKHHNRAIDYFKNRDNFIIFDIETEGDKLTEFLRSWSIPVTKFPHLYKS
jgi:hypothetical protein